MVQAGLKALVDAAHAHGLPVIYHGCGNVNRVFEDFIEVGVDAYNPLEAKAGMDVVELRRKYGHRMAFCGNLDALTWATGTMDELKTMVLTKLQRGQGRRLHRPVRSLRPQQRHGERYEFVVNLVREYGKLLGLGSGIWGDVA